MDKEREEREEREGGGEGGGEGGEGGEGGVVDKENGKKQGGMEEERKENLSCQVQESFANIPIFIVQHSRTILIDFQNNIFIFNILGRQVPQQVREVFLYQLVQCHPGHGQVRVWREGISPLPILRVHPLTSDCSARP